MTSLQLISPQQLPFQDLSLMGKRKVFISLNNEDKSIGIDNRYTPPISWFLTNEIGDLILSGQISDNYTSIDLSFIPQGIFYLRIAGEKHIIESK